MARTTTGDVTTTPADPEAEPVHVDLSDPAAAAPESAPAAEPVEIERPALKDITGLRFTGNPRRTDVRIMRPVDVPQLEETLRWDKSNNYTVSSSGLKAASVDFLLKTGEFETV